MHPEPLVTYDTNILCWCGSPYLSVYNKYDEMYLGEWGMRRWGEKKLGPGMLSKKVKKFKFVIKA